MIQTIRLSFLCWMAMVSCYAHAEWIDVEQAFPEFYQAVSNTKGVSAEMRDDFFSYWTPKESKLLESAIRKLEISRDEHGSNINAVNFNQYTGPLFAVLGELALAAQERYRYLKFDDVIIMNAWDIDSIKEVKDVTDNIPDGIVYKIDKKRIEIIAVLESKMGRMHFNKKQARGYFTAWAQSGMYFYNKLGKIQFYPANKIYFNMQGSAKTQKSMQQINFDEFLEFTTTMYSQRKEHHFGEYKTLDFNTKTAKRITAKFGRKLFQITENQISKKHQKQVRKTKKTGKKPTEILSKDKLREQLQQWFWSQKDNNKIYWPKAGLSFGGISGKALRRNTERYGNQAEMFIFFTSQKTKYLLTGKQALPHTHVFEQKLITASVASHDLFEAFNIYFMSFENSDGKFHTANQGALVKENYQKLYHSDGSPICRKQF